MSQSVDNLAGNLKLISLQFATIQLPLPPFFSIVCRVVIVIVIESVVSNNRIESKSNSLFLSHTLSLSFSLYRSCMECALNWPRMMLIMMTPRESLPYRRVQRRIAYAGAALSPISRCAFCLSTMSLSTGELHYPPHLVPPFPRNWL